MRRAYTPLISCYTGCSCTSLSNWCRFCCRWRSIIPWRWELTKWMRRRRRRGGRRRGGQGGRGRWRQDRADEVDVGGRRRRRRRERRGGRGARAWGGGRGGAGCGGDGTGTAAGDPAGASRGRRLLKSSHPAPWSCEIHTLHFAPSPGSSSSSGGSTVINDAPFWVPAGLGVLRVALAV